MPKVPYEKLTALFGKDSNDPAVTAVLKKAGDVEIDKDFIFAPEAGFDFALKERPRAKRNAPRQLSALFLFADGIDDHRGFAALPKPFVFGSRAELLARVPPPVETRSFGDNILAVDADPADIYSDRWELGGMQFLAMYKHGAIRFYWIAPPDDVVERDLSTHPLHFEAAPLDAPPDADLVGMALLVAWAITRHGLPRKHDNALGKQLVAREISPRTFLVKACGKSLSTFDVHPKLGELLHGYVWRTHRRKAVPAITKLLKLARPDELAYSDDFLGTFKTAVKSPYHVPDSWDAVDRIAPVLDARWADFEATRFVKPPDVKLYEQAAKLRDARSVTPVTAQVAAQAADDSLAADLVKLIGTSLKDPHARAVITRAGMPIGKVIDEQANPGLGVTYMGSKRERDKTRELRVTAVTLYGSKQSSYIRGIGKKVELSRFPGALPRGLAWGDSRKAVAKQLGKPDKTYEKQDYWQPKRGIWTTCMFERDKLVKLHFFEPDDYLRDKYA
jgi:hypothetical protein